MSKIETAYVDPYLSVFSSSQSRFVFSIFSHIFSHCYDGDIDFVLSHYIVKRYKLPTMSSGCCPFSSPTTVVLL
jgi:hypothetical protein